MLVNNSIAWLDWRITDCDAPITEHSSDLRGLDVFAQRFGLLVYLFNATLNHIANRHDADEFCLLYHRQVAKSSRGHAAHQISNSIVFRAGLNFVCHYLADRFAQHCRSVFGECLHNVALRQDAEDAVIGA